MWSFPRPDHLAIGICAQGNRTTAARLRREVTDWMDKTLGVGPDSAEPYSWPIPSLSEADWHEERSAENRWLLVGDAAGLVDPITREGIFFALQSGQLAADALTAGRDVAAAYRASLAGEIIGELRRAARFKATFFKPAFIRLLIEALNHSEAVRGVMADLVAGQQPYQGLRRRLARTFEVRLAWKLLTLRSSGLRLSGAPP